MVASNKKAKIVPLAEILQSMPYANEKEKALVKKAYAFAKEAHEGQKRYSGDPYFVHVAETGLALADMDMSAQVVAAGLLHDTVEDTDVTDEDIKREFGEEIAHMVDGVTKLGHVRYHGMQRHAESLRKLFAATSQDVRVMIIKLMDRLHNVKTLQYVPEHKRQRIALETLEIYAPIADRLGMGIIKKELEDAAFPYAYPQEYEKTYKIFKDLGGEDTKRLEKIHKSIKKKIAEYGIKDFRTSVRVKGLYSLYKKLQRKNNDPSKIKDIFALRVILKDIPTCYTVLSIIHGEWTPLPGKLKDYIALPKMNGYRSIHTTIHTGDGGVLEVQIRTEEMHQEAQYGVASHLTYKETTVGGKHEKAGSGLAWITQFFPNIFTGGKTDKNTCVVKKEEYQHKHYPKYSVPEWIRHLAEDTNCEDPEEFMSEIKSDFFAHRIFVFTPKGDVIDLPIGATPIDFAFAIHTDIGRHISGAKVNGKMESLDKELLNGDIVEIFTSKNAKPNRKWLDYVKTSMAKKQIKNCIQKARQNT